MVPERELIDEVAAFELTSFHLHSQYSDMLEMGFLKLHHCFLLTKNGKTCFDVSTALH